MIRDGLHDVPAGKVAMVVTHLEMTQPAAVKGDPLADGITFHQITPDLAWYRDIFERVGASWLWYGRRIMVDEDLSEVLNAPDIAFYTLEKDGQAEALLELDFRQEGQCELAYFGLTDRLIGSGAGRFLMDRAITLAWAQPITRLHVHTCTLDSPQALDFYIRSGFTPYKRQVEIDDDPRLVGLLPREVGRHVPLIE